MDNNNYSTLCINNNNNNNMTMMKNMSDNRNACFESHIHNQQMQQLNHQQQPTQYPTHQETQPQHFSAPISVDNNPKNRAHRSNSNSSHSSSPKKSATFGMSNNYHQQKYYQQQHVGTNDASSSPSKQLHMFGNHPIVTTTRYQDVAACNVDVVGDFNRQYPTTRQNNNYLHPISTSRSSSLTPTTHVTNSNNNNSSNTSSSSPASNVHAKKSMQATFNIQQEKIKKPRKTIKRKYQFKNGKSENGRSASSSPSSPNSQTQHSNESKSNSIETVSYYTITDGKELDLPGYYQHQLQYTTYDFYSNSSISIVRANPTYDVKSFKRSVDSISKDELLRVLHLTQQQASTILGCSVSTIKRRFYGLRNELGLTKWPNNYFEYSHMKLFDEIYPLSLNFILNKDQE